jgi:hypothetical protein
VNPSLRDAPKGGNYGVGTTTDNVGVEGSPEVDDARSDSRGK